MFTFCRPVTSCGLVNNDRPPSVAAVDVVLMCCFGRRLEWMVEMAQCSLAKETTDIL